MTTEANMSFTNRGIKSDKTYSVLEFAIAVLYAHNSGAQVFPDGSKYSLKFVFASTGAKRNYPYTVDCKVLVRSWSQWDIVCLK
jgi:hypothetical protein